MNYFELSKIFAIYCKNNRHNSVIESTFFRFSQLGDKARDKKALAFCERLGISDTSLEAIGRPAGYGL